MQTVFVFLKIKNIVFNLKELFLIIFIYFLKVILKNNYKI